MKTMIRGSMLLFTCVIFLTFAAKAQSKTDRTSPPKEASASIDGKDVSINYSSPAKKDRIIFGQLVPYDKVWRTGANEATTLTLGSDMEIGGKEVKAGKYGLFSVPGEKNWEIIINEVWDQWGAYNYDPSKDVVRFNAKTNTLAAPVEDFTINIGAEGTVTMEWDDASVSFEVQ
jgi:hypothetical protein